jgi:predicted permease
MEGIAAGLAQEHPETNEGWSVTVEPLKDAILGPAKARLTFFLGAVGLILVLACVSVANLQIARGTARAKEMAVRASLGADRGRMAGMLLAEGFILSLVGFAAGALLAKVGVPAFLALAPPEGIPRVDDIAVDGRALAFAMGAGVLTTLLFGLAPLTRFSNRLLSSTMRASDAHLGTRARSALVVFEVATAVVLLVGTGLLGRSFLAYLDHDPGFGHEAVAQSWMYSDGSDGAEVTVRRFRALADELADLPGVAAVGLGSSGPFSWIEPTAFWVDGGEIPESGAEPVAVWYDVDPVYFDALGIPLRRGRVFTPFDDGGSEPVVVVNEALVRDHFPGRDPIGMRLAIGHLDGGSAEIVGVVGDVTERPGDRARPTIYWPQLQHPRLATFFYIRTEDDPAILAPAIGERLQSAGSDLVVRSVTTMKARMGGRLVEPRFQLVLLWLFSAVALGLAGAGVYGLVAYAVSRRTREIGVRISLGAQKADVMRQVLEPTLRLLATGAVIGVSGALVLQRFIQAFLVGVKPTDLVTLVIAPLVLLGFGIAAGAGPALRATRIDPVRALRSE